MGPHDNPEAFLALFEHAVEMWGWLVEQSTAQQLPLLSEEAQLAAQELPPTNCLDYKQLM